MFHITKMFYIIYTAYVTLFLVVGVRECGFKRSPELGALGSELDCASQGRRGRGRELRGQATRGQQRRTDPGPPTQRGPLRPQGWHRSHQCHRGIGQGNFILIYASDGKLYIRHFPLLVI